MNSKIMVQIGQEWIFEKVEVGRIFLSFIAMPAQITQKIVMINVKFV